MTEDLAKWERRALSTLGNWRGGGTPSKGNGAFWKNGTIPWLTAKDMITFKISQTQDQITEQAIAESSASLLPAGAVVIVARSGILERKLPVAVSQMNLTINQDIKALICSEDVLPEWVAYGLLAYEQEILDKCRKSGTTVANLNFQEFLKFQIPVPHVNLQLRTIEQLEGLLSRVERAQKKLSAINGFPLLSTSAAQISTLRRSILIAAFSGHLAIKDSND